MKKLCVLTLCIATLSACEAPVLIAASANDAEGVGLSTVTFPAKMLWVSNDGPDRLFSGKMIGSLAGHADFDVTSTDGLQCVGRAEKDGGVTMTCDGGQITYRGAPANKAFSGVRYADVGDDLQSAFGWGKGANEDLLRLAIAEQRDIEAAEARQRNPG